MRWVIAVGLLSLVIGCSGGDSPGVQMGGGQGGGAGGQGAAGGGGQSSPGAGGAGGSLSDSGLIQFPNSAADSSYLFDPDEIRTYELRLDPDDLAAIDQNPTAEQYVPGTLVFEGQEYTPVGIRYKGSIGAFQNCTTGGGLMPSGAKTCPKLSMKVKFNWQLPEGLFYGMKRIQFHAMNNDPSLLRERLGYSLFRDMGVPTARTVHVRLRINGEEAGLFALVEQIEGTFARRTYPDGGKGNLYKEVWPAYMDSSAYQLSLKTNEDENPSFDKFVRFASDLQSATDTELPGVLERWMDVEQTIRYIAVDRAIENDDGIFHWYCVPGGGMGNSINFLDQRCFNHNYYWYESTESDRFWLIPWDLDFTWRPDVELIQLNREWNDTSTTCTELGPLTFGIIGQMDVQCDPLARGLAMFDAEFKAAVAELLAGPLSPESVDAKLDTWMEQIRPIVRDGLVLDPLGRTEAEWESEVASFRLRIEEKRVEAQSWL